VVADCVVRTTATATRRRVSASRRLLAGAETGHGMIVSGFLAEPDGDSSTSRSELDGISGADMVPAESGEVVDFGPFRLYCRHRKLFCGRDEIDLGGRATDVLLALARRKGELVTKEQLFEAAWPNVSVHESNLKVTVAALRRALREFSPSHEYITTVVGRGYWLGPEPPAEEFHSRAIPPAVVAGHPLPELGMVIGRDIEIAELHETLASNRLTTIVGAGGMGKTTVAVAAAQLFEDEGGGSVIFVDLARVASEEFVTSSLAAALGISSDSHDSLHAIVSILAVGRPCSFWTHASTCSTS
jgi:DNA-binding winged helix-turn-helix (wHTH) protein